MQSAKFVPRNSVPATMGRVSCNGLARAGVNFGIAANEEHQHFQNELASLESLPRLEANCRGVQMVFHGDFSKVFVQHVEEITHLTREETLPQAIATTIRQFKDGQHPRLNQAGLYFEGRRDGNGCGRIVFRRGTVMSFVAIFTGHNEPVHISDVQFSSRAQKIAEANAQRFAMVF